MDLVGLPTTPITAGQTICVTVTGATAPLVTGYEGSVKVLSSTQSSTRPNEWTVCFTVAHGLGSLTLQSGNKTHISTFRGR